MGKFCACNCEKQERALRRQGHFFVCFEIQTMTARSGKKKTERAPSREYDRSKNHESERTKTNTRHLGWRQVHRRTEARGISEIGKHARTAALATELQTSRRIRNRSHTLTHIA